MFKSEQFNSKRHAIRILIRNPGMKIDGYGLYHTSVWYYYNKEEKNALNYLIANHGLVLTAKQTNDRWYTNMDRYGNIQ